MLNAGEAIFRVRPSPTTALLLIPKSNFMPLKGLISKRADSKPSNHDDVLCSKLSLYFTAVAVCTLVGFSVG